MAFLNYEDKRGSGKKLKVHFELPEDDDYPNQKHSISSSESSLNSDDSDKNYNSIDNVDSKCNLYGSPVWSFQGGSVTQSPPVQFMTSPGYDPNRIPSSVFANRSTSPMEWSVASNESLFSIHLGNNSFSRDHAFPNNKSGELARINDGVIMPSTLPPVQEVNANGKNLDMERHSVSSDSSSESENSVARHETAGSVVGVVDLKKTETSEVGTNAKVLGKTQEDYHKEEKALIEKPKNYNSVSYRSVGSDMSIRSFQFPILTADGVRNSSSTVESEKQEKTENQEQQQPEKALEPPSPKAEKEPKQSGKSWCFCFSCSPCF